MMRRIQHILPYAVFGLFAATMLALAVLTIRSFWIADVFSCQGEDIQSPSGMWLGTRYVLSSGRGRFYVVADYQHPPVRYSKKLTTWSTYYFTQALADFHPMMIMPTHGRDYVLFWHGTLVGRPLISNFRDPTGKSDMLRERDIIVPAWGPLGLCAGVCGWLVLFPIRRRWRTARRLREGLCLKCGYDLRAHQPGGRCPECGTVKAGNPSSAT